MSAPSTSAAAGSAPAQKPQHRAGLSLSSASQHSVDSTLAGSMRASLSASRSVPSTSSVHPPVPPLPSLGLVATNPLLEQLHALAHKRWTTFDHLARVFTGAGTTPFLGAICISTEDLNYAYDNIKMKRRSQHLFVLGVSLAPLLDVPGRGDFVRAVHALVGEYDNWVASMNRTRSIFRSKKADADDDIIHGLNSDDFTYLAIKNIPFDLDYVQVFTTMCQIFTRAYLIFHAFTECDASTVEAVLKIDSRFKKWIGIVMRELDAVMRGTVKDEIRGLDPVIWGSSGLEEWDVPTM